LPEDTSRFDVVVIGGGVIGLSVAWRAAQRGLTVCVLERGEPGGATSAVGAGMLAPVSEAVFSERGLLSLGLASAAAYPSFVSELEDMTGEDAGYEPSGTLLAARDADEAEWLGRELAMRTRLGLENVRRLLPSEARRMEPALAPTLRGAAAIDDDHAVDPRKLTKVLVRALRAEGGELRTGSYGDHIVIKDDRVTGVVQADGEWIAADQVVIAAGPWSSAIAGLPERARVPVHPVKGQIIRMHDPNGPGLLSRVLRLQTCYVVPRGDGRYVLGATMEERGFDQAITAGAVYELLRDAGELLPGIQELVIDELSAGFRPATPDNAPAIGAGAVDGLNWATGHYRHGILLAPITAEILAGLLAGDKPSPLAAPFAPSRFSTQSHPVPVAS
jgi:glycine oxidase